MKFSECVNEFVSLWINWMKANNIAIDKKYAASERRRAAIKAELLIKKRYKLVQEVDKHFSKYDE